MAKFKPGQSGNPRGKKPGTLNKRTELIGLLEPHATSLINKTVELALNGDINALRLCIERLLPKAKEQNIKVTIPDIKGKTINETVQAVLTALQGKEVTISELKDIMFLIREDADVPSMSESERLEIHNIINNLMKKYEREY